MEKRQSFLLGENERFLPLPRNAGGRTRTGTELPPSDFESDASANFATPAGIVMVTHPLSFFKKIPKALHGFLCIFTASERSQTEIAFTVPAKAGAGCSNHLNPVEHQIEEIP